MLNEVVVRNSQGASLPLPLDSIDSGIIVKKIDGLDPVAASITSTSFAQLDGEQYQFARREKRNILMTVGLEPYYSSVDNTVRGLRQYLYQFFMPKSEVTLRFNFTNDASVEIKARIESFNSPLFTSDPEVVISLLAFNPDFVDPVVVKLNGSTTTGVTPTNVEYEGTVETGILFTLNVNRSMSGFTLHNVPTDNQERSLLFVAPLLKGDQVLISTVPGSKSATLIRNRVTRSILYGVSPLANWIQLYPGTNRIRVVADGATVPYTIEYTRKYGGL